MLMLRNTNPLLLAAFLAAGAPGCVSKLPLLEVTNEEVLVRNSVGSFDVDLKCVVEAENGIRVRRLTNTKTRRTRTGNPSEHKPSRVLPREATRPHAVIESAVGIPYDRGRSPFRWGIQSGAAPTGEIGWPFVIGRLSER
jgi:hypothetical protein